MLLLLYYKSILTGEKMFTRKKFLKKLKDILEGTGTVNWTAALMAMLVSAECGQACGRRPSRERRPTVMARRFASRRGCP